MKEQLKAFFQRLYERRFWQGLFGSLYNLLIWCRGRVEGAATALGHAWKAILMLGLLLSAAVFVHLLWVECHKTVAVIGRIEAPEDLQKKGYAPQVLGNHLADALLAIDQGSGTLMPHQHAISDFQQADVILSEGISLRALLRFLKEALGHADVQISGDAIVEGDKLELRARVIEAQGEPRTLSQPGKTGEIEKALSQLAEQVMDVVDPYILGAHWMQQEVQSCRSKPECDFSKSIGQYQKIINNPGKNEESRKRIAWAYLGWSYVHSLRREFDKELEKTELAVQSDPGNAVAYSNWGHALINLGKPGEAIEKCRKAVELDPKFADAYNNWGTALFKLGKPGEAIGKFRKAAELDPKYAVAYYNWGNAILKLGKPEEAIEKYRKVLDLDPKFVGAYINLGLLLAQVGSDVEALELARSALDNGLKPGDLGEWPCVVLQSFQQKSKLENYPADAARFGCER